MKNTILVILYGKEISESKTLNCLVDVELKNQYTSLEIYSNGPNLISFSEDLIYGYLKERFNEVTVKQDVGNSSLSVIYNEFLKGNADRYFIFDDDTTVPSDYLKIIDSDELNTPIDLQLPLVKSVMTDDIYYPYVDNIVISSEMFLNNNQSVRSIGSGLIIHNNLVSKFIKYNITPFDERFALYGVDFSLFRRIEILKNRGEFFNIVVSNFIPHSLSRDESFIPYWRKKERLIDWVLTTKYYSKNKFLSYIIMVKIFLKYLIQGEFGLSIYCLSIFNSGKHPRCK